MCIILGMYTWQLQNREAVVTSQTTWVSVRAYNQSQRQRSTDEGAAEVTKGGDDVAQSKIQVWYNTAEINMTTATIDYRR